MTRPFFVLAACASIVCAFSTQSTAAQPQHAGDTIRWEIDDQAEEWIGYSIALGDHGSGLIAGKILRDEARIALHSTASPNPIWEFSVFDVRHVQVAAAQAAPTLAAVTSLNLGTGANLDLRHTLRVWHHAKTGSADWQFRFPLTHVYATSSVGVRVSADGQRIVAWSVNGNMDLFDLRVFDLAGNELMQANIAGVNGGDARGTQGALTPDASRLLIGIGSGGAPHLIDLRTGQVIQVWNARSKSGGLAISDDGKTVAIGDLNLVDVYRENAQGSFSSFRNYALQGKRIGGPLALDSDGSHLAYSVNWDQNSEKTQIRVQDLGPDIELWRQEIEALGNQKTLWISGIGIAEDAAVVAASSWGDDARKTPTGFVFDQTGDVVSFIRTEGSVFEMDYDPAAELVAFATKDSHLSGFGPYGGDLICADARPAELKVAGQPNSASMMEITLQGSGDQASLAASRGLGNSATPYGTSQLEFGKLLKILPPLPLTAGGATIQVQIPGAAALIGQPIHLQAALIDTPTASGYLSNRVSIRILP